MKRIYICLIFVLCLSGSTQAQTEVTLFRQGLALQKAGRLEEAIQSYEKAIALDNDYADAHYQLGRVYYLQATRKNNVKEITGQHEKLFPKQQYVPKWKYGKKELDLAIKEFEEVVRIEPEAADALFMLGLLNHNKGLYDTAIEWHKKAINVSRYSADALDARHDIALIYYHIKNNDAAAIELLRTNLEIYQFHSLSKELLELIENKSK